MAEIYIATELVVAQRLATNDGYTWTLASLLGHMLRRAEELYGRRDTLYTILGIEFIDGKPQSWFPDNCRNIVIQLGTDSLCEPMRAYFQLAHECIHLLSPVRSEESTVLEEGLATHFQIEYMRDTFRQPWHVETANYTRACELVSKLLAINPDSIKILRANEPTISRIRAEQINSVCPSLTNAVCQELVNKFQ